MNDTSSSAPNAASQQDPSGERPGPQEGAHQQDGLKDEIEPERVAEAAREGLTGVLVPKGDARQFASEHPLPTHAAESALARFLSEDLSSQDVSEEGQKAKSPLEEEAAQAALRKAEATLQEGVLRPGNEEVFKSRLGDGEAKDLVDRIEVHYDASQELYIGELARLGEKAQVREEIAQAHERLLQDGLHAEVSLEHRPEKGPLPFMVTGVRPLQPSGPSLLETIAQGRRAFSAGEWACFLVRSAGLDPFEGNLGSRAIGLILLRMVPLCERNYNLVELGPRGTGKSHVYGQLTSRAHLLAGGKASVSKLFVHTGTGERGLVTSRDVVAFDEISSTSFAGDEVVSALKGYMESGRAGRGKETVEGRASIVMLGNIDEPPGKLLRERHLLSAFPERIRQDTALMDRIHAYLPGWEVPKIEPGDLADGWGLASGVLAEGLHRLRARSLSAQIGRRAKLEGNLSQRDQRAALKTASGLLKLIYPGLVATQEGENDEHATSRRPIRVSDVPRSALRWALWLGLEGRLRVRQQQHRIHPGEFEDGDFRLRIDPSSGEAGEEQVFLPEESST